MRDGIVEQAFRSELAKCECTACKTIVRAIFAVLTEPEARSKIMDGYMIHCDTCYFHRYQAHQDG